jgi:1,4-alpha-glucan branching enzyme
MIGKGSRKGTVRFSIRPGEGAKKAKIAGDFNNWQPQAMRKNRKGEFVAVVPLDKGTYEYKYLVDGRWVSDPDNNTFAANPYGTLNSVASIE